MRKEMNKEKGRIEKLPFVEAFLLFPFSLVLLH